MEKVNLGCGSEVLHGYTNLDINPSRDDVIECDFENSKLPFKDNSVDELRAIDVLEHLHKLIPFMNECYRVIKEGGVFYIEVPMFPSNAAIADPTHVRYFVPDTFKYIGEYQDTQDMYGIKPWRIKSLETKKENRIFVELIK